MNLRWPTSIITVLLLISIVSPQGYLGSVDGWVFDEYNNTVPNATVRVVVVGCTPEGAPQCEKNDTTDINGYYAVTGLDLESLGEVFCEAWNGTHYGNNTAYADEYGTAQCNITIYPDRVPPKWEDLVYSDPVALNDIQVINITVYDPNGVDKVVIELNGTNYTMRNVEDDVYQFSRRETSLGIVYVTIYMNDTLGNVNKTNFTYEVKDLTPPQWSDLNYINPVALGRNQTVNITVTDDTQVDRVIIEIDGVNYTMNYAGDNVYNFTRKEESLGTHDAIIYMIDIYGNSNRTSFSYNVTDQDPPYWSNLEYLNPAIHASYHLINITVTDNVQVDTVILDHNGTNITMVNVAGNVYQAKVYEDSLGTIYAKIYMNDTSGNYNVTSFSYNVTDQLPPKFYNLSYLEIVSVENNQTINVTVIDDTLVDTVMIELNGTNYTMSCSGNECTFTRKENRTGKVFARIIANDTYGNYNVTEFTYTVGDIEAPELTYISYLEKIELGDINNITFCFYEPSGIDTAILELDNKTNVSANKINSTCLFYEWRHTLMGYHTFRIIANDTYGNTMTTGYYSFNVTYYYLYLHEGYTLISFPFNLSNYSIREVLKPILDKVRFVLRWNPYKQDYEVWSPHDSDPPFDEFDPRHAYFILVPVEGGVYLPINGTYIDDMNISVIEGWNTIAWPYEFSQKIKIALASIDGNYSWVLRWKTSVQDFQAYTPHDANPPFDTFDKGFGYFVKIDVASELIVFERESLEPI